MVFSPPPPPMNNKDLKQRRERAEIALKVYEALHREFMKTNDIPTLDFIEEIQQIVLKRGIGE